MSFDISNFDNVRDEYGAGFEQFARAVNWMCIYLNYLNIAVQSLFLYVVLCNWCRRAKYLKSSYFNMFALRVFMEWFTGVYAIVWIWLNQVLDTYRYNNYYFHNWLNDYYVWYHKYWDVACHLALCANRIMAFFYPVLFREIFTMRGNTVIILMMYLLAGHAMYFDWRWPFFGNIGRPLLSVVALFVVAVPLWIKSKVKPSGNEKQLLLESVFSSCFLIPNMSAQALLSVYDYRPPLTVGVLWYLTRLCLNVYMGLCICFLIYISSAAKEAVVRALPFLQVLVRKKDTEITVFSISAS